MALQLQRRGIEARPLAGGYRAWSERYPVVPKDGLGIAVTGSQ